VTETIGEQPPAAVSPAATAPTEAPGRRLPARGDRVERTRNGVTRRGRVFYADDLQLLVKWDDGSSSSVRVDKDEFKALALAPRLHTPPVR
jgi:hypothetical protein